MPASFENSLPITHIRHDAKVAKCKPRGMQVVLVQPLSQPRRFLARDLSGSRILGFLDDGAVANGKDVA